MLVGVVPDAWLVELTDKDIKRMVVLRKLFEKSLKDCKGLDTVKNCFNPSYELLGKKFNPSKPEDRKTVWRFLGRVEKLGFITVERSRVRDPFSGRINNTNFLWVNDDKLLKKYNIIL